jgi:aspartate aminotransferase
MTVSTPSQVFAERIGRIEVSATMAVAAEAAKLRAQGANLVDFGAGEPHFPTPRHIKDAAIAAIDANFTRYTVVPGIPDVRKAIVERHASDFGSDYGLDEAIFTTGGKLALFNTIQILVEHGDEVILPVPYWVSFKDIIQYAGGKVVYLETSEAESFRITADAIEKAITPKTKAIILNSPARWSPPKIWSGSSTWPMSGAFFCFWTSATSISTMRASQSPAARLPGPRSTWSCSVRSQRPMP